MSAQHSRHHSGEEKKRKRKKEFWPPSTPVVDLSASNTQFIAVFYFVCLFFSLESVAISGRFCCTGFLVLHAEMSKSLLKDPGLQFGDTIKVQAETAGTQAGKDRV